MKTSNKILLGIVIGPLLILTFIHVVIYASYKSGHYVVMKTVEEDRYTRRVLKNIRHVAVYGLDNFRIVPYDTCMLQIEKETNGHLHYTIRGDSLIIHGDSAITRASGTADVLRSRQSVRLSLPVAATVAANFTDITIEGSKDSSRAIAIDFLLSNHCNFKVDDNGNDTSAVYFKDMTIQASATSGIELTANTRISALHLTLFESEFTDAGASIENLAVEADKVSTITLKGKNLKKINITRQP